MSAALSDIMERERPTCSNCKSSLRYRSLIAALQEQLFSEVMPLVQLRRRKEIKGLGMSDLSLYSRLLAEKFNYVNTFYHKEPHLDIAELDPRFENQFDFVVSSDVVEHVRPPIERSFRNLRLLLRPGGVLILTTPFGLTGGIAEHYPGLYRFEIAGSGRERHLVNITQEGQKQIFHNLIFHDGEGSTLEMRIFSRPGLLRLLRVSGFTDIRIHAKSFPEWGIVCSNPCSLPISAVAA